MKKFLHILPPQFILPLFIVAGVVVGLGAYTVYMAKVHSYASDSPSACVNCHIMTPYYQSWMHSSHGNKATCNDCHVPQNNALEKYAFKAIDGLYHSAVFTLKKEPQVIRPREASSGVIMNNCIRCHTQLNTEFVKTGMIDFAQTKEGKGKVCWECHRQIPHTVVSNLSSSPHAIAPMPNSPVPQWLKDLLNKETE